MAKVKKKRCNKCKKKKPYSEFHKRNTRCADGLQPYCKSCKKEKDKLRYNTPTGVFKVSIRDRRNIIYAKIYAILLQSGCTKCDEKNPACLTFHHRDSTTKEFGISTAKSNWDKVLKEIEKCDILCFNCHMKETAIQFNWYNNNPYIIIKYKESI